MTISYNDFIKKGINMGFTDEQVNFLWWVEQYRAKAEQLSANSEKNNSTLAEWEEQFDLEMEACEIVHIEDY